MSPLRDIQPAGIASCKHVWRACASRTAEDAEDAGAVDRKAALFLCRRLRRSPATQATRCWPHHTDRHIPHEATGLQISPLTFVLIGIGKAVIVSVIVIVIEVPALLLPYDKSSIIVQVVRAGSCPPVAAGCLPATCLIHLSTIPLSSLRRLQKIPRLTTLALITHNFVQITR